MLPPVLEKPAFTTPRVKPGIDLGQGDIRLNLGGIGDEGKTNHLPGFYIVDLQDNPLVDIQSDISWLPMFKDESVTEIYASNCLEHFPHTQTVDVLKEWFRVLKKGATLWISVPDMDANFRLYQKHGLSLYVRNIIWGDQIHPYAYHYINFSFGSLAEAVTDAGFSDVVRLAQMPFGLKDASAHLDSIDRLSVSLNVKVTK